MDGNNGRRKACPSWSAKEIPRISTGLSLTWSGALVDDLMETNVIANQNMAILKEMTSPQSDPALMSDLRHNKDLRPTHKSVKGHSSISNVMMEAKRILRREEKAKKMLRIQDSIISDEVDKFQNHITSLRRMNQRLEKIAFPAVKKRPSKLINVYHLKQDCGVFKSLCDDEPLPCQEIPELISDHQTSSSSQKHYNQPQNERWDDELHVDKCGNLSPSCGKISLSISGNKLEDHEILHHNPTASSEALSEHQNTVFERIHQKYMESERNRILKEGTAFIRHSSPVNETRVQNVEDTKIVPIASNTNHVQVGAWAEDFISDSYQLTHNTEVFINECSLPSTVNKDFHDSRTKSINEGGEEASLDCIPSKITDPGKDFSSDNVPPPIARKKSGQNTLESMSKMYAKWMSKVCVSSKLKLQDLSSHKNSKMKEKGGSCTQRAKLSSASREEKIMEVLRALQRHKDEKLCLIADKSETDTSRFSKSVNDIREENSEMGDQKFRRAISGTYEHRLRAHRELITHQKVKLEEQKKVIEDLKLTQLKMEHEKSQRVTQKALNEVMQTCNAGVKAHAKSLKSSLSLAELSPGNDFVLRMEQRVLEQKQRKILAQERRKQLEEDRKKRIRDFDEKKRLEEEEIFKKRHDEVQEIRRKEREMREEARKEREKFIILERKADVFYQRRQLRYVILSLKKLSFLRIKQEQQAMEFYDKFLVQKVLRVWKRDVDCKVQARIDFADNFYACNLLQRCFSVLKISVQERMRHLQVAMDMHDFHLQDKYFRVWLNFTHEQNEIEANKIDIADLHFTKVLVRRCVIQWRKYPKVAQLEREKERRKMIWRSKVQQLLPDFRPILSSD